MRFFCLYLVLFSWCNLSPFAQTELEIENDFFVYPISKEVNNYFDLSIIEKLYHKNLESFESNKDKVFKKLAQSAYIEDQLKKSPDYFSFYVENSFEESPYQVEQYFALYDIFIDVDEVSFKCLDTSTYRKIYENKINELRTETIGTKIEWSLEEFATIKKSRPISNYNTLLDVKDIIMDTVLVDGEYVMYYDPIYNHKSKTFLTKVPYCYFEIKNFKPDGNAVFFTHTGDTLATGKYIDGKQEGEWKVNLPYYSEPNSIDIEFGSVSVNGEVMPFKPEKNKDFGWSTYIIDYKKGEPHGKFVFKQDEQIRTTGSIKNKKPIGNWKMYHKNGQLANSFTLREDTLRINQPSLYPKVSNKAVLDKEKTKPYDPFPHYINILPVGNHASSILGLVNSYFIDKRNVFDNGVATYTADIQFYNFIDSTNLHEYYIKDDFEAYFENGQLYFKMHVNEAGKLIEFSNVFDDHGNLILEWKLNEERTEAEVIKYDKNGETKSIDKTYIKNGKQIWKK
ncbi:MAG: hypothetical protein ACQERC_12410 [Bacteroidota bacterium]